MLGGGKEEGQLVEVLTSLPPNWAKPTQPNETREEQPLRQMGHVAFSLECNFEPRGMADWWAPE